MIGWHWKFPLPFGLLLGAIHVFYVGTTSPLLQQHFSPASRKVPYRAHSRRQHARHRAEPTHFDASWQSPDEHFDRIRRRIKDNAPFQYIARRLVQPNGRNSSGFINADKNSSGLASSPDFNISAKTELNLPTSNSTLNETSSVIFTESEHRNKTVATPQFRPIRIRAFLNESVLTLEQKSALLQDMLQPALLAWSAALRVIPVAGNLTIDKKQLTDGTQCGPSVASGLPTVTVPSAHISQGVQDTDLILYINLGFAPNNTNINNTATLSPSVNTTDGTGNATNSSFWNFDVTPITREKVTNCSGDYLASSAFCSTDQQDRPTAGILHLCIDQEFFEPSKLDRNIMAILHEMGHILGFNSLSLAHFRLPDGTPMTPRNADGSVPVRTIECTGPYGSRPFANVTLPGTDILQFREVRQGVRVADIVTPNVQQVVRNHFGCQDLPGAELESAEPQPSQDTSCIGDHWERRLFKSDLMNPLIDNLEFSSRFSTITLAYFADSGWYQVDLSRAAEAVNWGRGAGCSFVNETCIQNGLVPQNFDAFFCNDLQTWVTNIHGCTFDLARKAACALGRYDSPLPPAYQYFNSTYGPNVGGNDPFMDFCPVFSGFSNGLCSDSGNDALIRVDSVERFGERNSRCLTGKQNNAVTALCLPIACVVEDRSLRIQIDGNWRICEYKNQHLQTQNSGQVICPDPAQICPTFYCQRDCLGTQGICDYEIGECVCNATGKLALLGEPCDELVENQSTPELHEPFYNSEQYSGEKNKLPGKDSPLSDYYVPTQRALKDEAKIPVNIMRDIWVICSFLLVISIIFFLYRRRKRAWDEPEDDGNADDDMGQVMAFENHNPDKDKMMATVVVDLRTGGRGIRSVGDVLQYRLSETDVSMTDTEGTVAPLADLSLDEPEGIPLDPLAPPNSPVVRRRNRHTFA